MLPKSPFTKSSVDSPNPPHFLGFWTALFSLQHCLWLPQAGLRGPLMNFSGNIYYVVVETACPFLTLTLMTWEARIFSSQLYICTVQHSNWHQLGVWWTFIELNQSLTHSPSSVTSFTISLLTLWSWLFWSTWQVYGADFVEVKMNLLSGYTMVGLCISSFLWWNVISSSPFKLQPRHLPSAAWTSPCW